MNITKILWIIVGILSATLVGFIIFTIFDNKKGENITQPTIIETQKVIENKTTPPTNSNSTQETPNIKPVPIPPANVKKGGVVQNSAVVQDKVTQLFETRNFLNIISIKIPEANQDIGSDISLKILVLPKVT